MSNHKLIKKLSSKIIQEQKSMPKRYDIQPIISIPKIEPKRVIIIGTHQEAAILQAIFSNLKGVFT